MKIPEESASTCSGPRTPAVTGAAKSRWRLNPRCPAGPGAWGWPVDAAASGGVAASGAEGAWARLQDLSPRELRSSGVDAATSDGVAASGAEGVWAGLRDLSPPRAKEQCCQRERPSRRHEPRKSGTRKAGRDPIQRRLPHQNQA
ncbi:hypothetical protein NDU88_010380 [Pleurodeles waltl]|uniref:Uncharacterized protein n=1 Tax=Pleurodeles waltl TaxID=8319 RepID=A0AAV7R022_PLEWA|nr:hypothetical protein NDU88_010380 [Pleurodeles waltl]